MTSYYTYNVFPYGTYEISAAILLQYNNNTVYPDITNLIKDYSVFLEEHIRYCNDFYISSRTNNYNKIIIECMAKSDHMDILNSNSEFLADMKKRLKHIETTLDMSYSNNLKNILREILWRRYSIYKREISTYLNSLL
jgi:hypothetical protein